MKLNLFKTPKEKLKENFCQKLEALHIKKDSDQLDFILENLDHSDRFTRFAARIALENQDYNLWKDKIKEDNTSLKTIVLALFYSQIWR